MTFARKLREKAIDGFLLSLFFILFSSIAYAAISWPASAPDGEVVGGKYSAKLTPSGAVIAFELSSCPTGWSAADGTNGHADLRGTFVRGIGGDTNGRDVVRTLLSYQTDDFKSHNHGGVFIADGSTHGDYRSINYASMNGVTAYA